jgi:DNA-binding response OmpR family regulator
MRVLVVDDDDAVRRSLAHALTRDGYEVTVAADGVTALESLTAARHDAVVLDILMPEPNGLEVCRRLRAGGDRTPILMLTARDLVADRVAGLDAGADDYLAKPFAFAELVARIGALCRRAQEPLPPVLGHADLTVDTARRIATRAGRPVPLTPKEFGVLELLLAARGRVVPAEELLDRVWDEAADPFTHAVKITVSRLRAKLGDPPLIETVAKSGYRI